MAKKGNLAARYNHSYQTKDSGATNPAFNWRDVDIDVQFYKPKEGKNRINIIPFPVKSKNHPLVHAKVLQIGDQDYVMDYYVHRNIGPSQSDIICLKKNYSKPCPICEAAEEFKQKGKDKEYKALKPTRRCLYNVVDLKNPEKGVQVFEASHFNFEKELIEEARAASDDQNMIDFADVDDGRTIVFRAAPAKFDGREFLEFKSFQFVEREDDVDDDMLEATISFDEIMKVLTYDQIKKLLYGQDDDEEPMAHDLRDEPDDEDSKGKSKGKSKSKDDDDEENESKGKGKGKSRNDDDDEDEEDEDDGPKKGKGKRDDPPFDGGKKVDKGKDKSKSKDDDDEDEDEKSKGKSKRKSKDDDDDDDDAGPKCPSKHKFGKDNDEFPECDDCKLWDKCARAQK